MLFCCSPILTDVVLYPHCADVTFKVLCLEDKTLPRPFTMPGTCLLSSALDTILKGGWSLTVRILHKEAIHVWISQRGSDGEHSWINVGPKHILCDFLTESPNDEIYKHRLMISLLTNQSMDDQFRFNESDLDFTDDDSQLTKRALPPVTTNVTLKLIHARMGHEYEAKKVSTSWNT